MAQPQRTDILFPVGRLVQGSVSVGRDKDSKGQPLVIKYGPGAGKPRTDFYFAVAIPKKPGEQAWWQTEWGNKIMAVGAAAFPNFYQNPAFSWKVEDGDSTVPNKSNRKNCDNEGFPGNWIVKFSGGYAPKIVTADGSQQITEPDAVKPGYFVQVFGNIAGNGSTESPGVYVNHTAVAMAGYGPEIRQGPDLSSVGFGQGVTLPPGASATPLAQMPGAMAAPQMAMPGAMQAPQMGMQMPGAMAMPGPAVAPQPQMQMAPQPTMVAPDPGFLAPPAPGSMPTPGAMPTPAAEPALTPKGISTGYTYAQFKASGQWTDDLLRQHGYIA